jgi:hypothetical protein
MDSLITAAARALAADEPLGALWQLAPPHMVIILHSPDLPVWPGGPKFGMGVWISLH